MKQKFSRYWFYIRKREVVLLNDSGQKIIEATKSDVIGTLQFWKIIPILFDVQSQKYSFK